MEERQFKTGWKGFLSFKFVADLGRTVVKDKKHFGPLVIQRPYYQEVDLPQVLILHPPGGIVGGDELQIEVGLSKKAKGMVSTPAATKFYRSNNRLATQSQFAILEEEAELEWLPQETLFFESSNADNVIRFQLHESCKLIAWDIVGLGRPESGEVYAKGQLKQRLEFILNGKKIFIDRLTLVPNSPLLASQTGFCRYSLFATALFYTSDLQSQDSLLDLLQSQSWLTSVGVTKVSDGLIVLRALSSQLDDIKDDLYKAWVLARPLILGRQALKPRIWNT
ncbi:urease accessory protein UreD [Hydrogenovibrio kuenenii]|uniref:urease accessory protein UreD n=1 Tax=Hydrogenovibrio kuenenii TaxID=63658 RepID=UPI0004631E35|nr:urease accessory protein UreD [Hydrogenovibrio kuenenii]